MIGRHIKKNMNKQRKVLVKEESINHTHEKPHIVATLLERIAILIYGKSMKSNLNRLNSDVSRLDCNDLCLDFKR